MHIDNELLENGRLLPLVEDFYTLQGEGYHTGKAAYFIRIGGCDIGCYWCDAKFTWNPKLFPPVRVEKVIERALKHKAKAVVVTGGEPSLYPLDYLCEKLKENGFETYLETSGAYPLSGQWDWICLSPKQQHPPLAGIHAQADELKVIIASHKDLEWAEANAKLVKSKCRLFLQPEWSVYNSIIGWMVEYVKENPKWQISLQAHKFMRIP
ncbi:MAG TPA: 7-carboxy-7-deazaguanine synthase QueE [Tenuifilaceae bacterium]|jgi:organic radical activating enzyme|nr:7-carboxy-7-deazaguanine synthase QueE [Bacteroidales bacterium]MDI9516719.1 7-carboxy-7-deazaguanine synthase QueE [Bacteroidota bacterium]NLH56961.1 7-carboxy-7-deazaguanine synthase QueE [Rikenellaceae bacterium]OQC61015.1 MAG: 7-carboxy-7-deazaguanine synthase [Bacteroidetes bacterium ADurb.Bin008]HNV82029.1 7-carboxy-7-deazaguanine synthase QueE [Tenuifilaceae bacterium]